MATEEHIKLSNYIKEVHKQLRENTKKFGVNLAWAQHVESKHNLKIYSEAMNKLAFCWDQNLKNDISQQSRILWCVKFCTEYFHNDRILEYQRSREKGVLDKIGITAEYIPKDIFMSNCKIKLLDVGSCYNPFKCFTEFDVTAIDISPANQDVLECDFLNIAINTLNCDESKLLSLPPNSFDVLIFSLLLEYLPTSCQRKSCCQKAYQILDTEGILIIITPDSKNIGANAKLMKNWRYTLALIGFSRIKYEKLEHITCMVFRKGICKELTERWAEIHKEEYMTDEIFIPQDFNNDELVEEGINEAICSVEDKISMLSELPTL